MTIDYPSNAAPLNVSASPPLLDRARFRGVNAILGKGKAAMGDLVASVNQELTRFPAQSHSPAKHEKDSISPVAVKTDLQLG